MRTGRKTKSEARDFRSGPARGPQPMADPVAALAKQLASLVGDIVGYEVGEADQRGDPDGLRL